MEITAALRGLEELSKPSRVTIVTDSQYVFKSMTGWIEGWSKKLFRKKGELIPNAELWQTLARASLQHDTSWAWTRGHDGDPLNERCDELVGDMRGRRPNGDDDVLHRKRGPLLTAPGRVSAQRTTRIWLAG
jgi:ribonuclease HI